MKNYYYDKDIDDDHNELEDDYDDKDIDDDHNEFENDYDDKANDDVDNNLENDYNDDDGGYRVQRVTSSSWSSWALNLSFRSCFEAAADDDDDYQYDDFGDLTIFTVKDNDDNCYDDGLDDDNYDKQRC